MTFHEPDDHVGSTLFSSMPLVEHGEGLSDACGCAKVDPEVPCRLDVRRIV
jgi:hypothetical protein